MSYLSILFSKNHITHPLSGLKYSWREVPFEYNQKSMVAQSVVAGTITAGMVRYLSGPSSKSVIGAITSSAIVIIGSVGYFYCLAAKYKSNKLQSLHLDIAEKKVTKIAIDPNKPISNGFGEFIVSKNSGEETTCLSEQEYEAVYPVLLRYSPSSFDAANVKRWSAQFAMRDTLIAEEVSRIDPRYQVTFIPRTLYELVLIEECIQEDRTAQIPCSFCNPNHQEVLHYPRTNNENTRQFPEAVVKWQQRMVTELQTTKQHCWHRCYFHEAELVNIELLPEVKNIAYRMNVLLTKKIGSFSAVLSYQKILALTEERINFLKAHHTQEILPTEELRGKFLENTKKNPGPTICFHYENEEVYDLHPMGLRNDKDAEILRNAIALECSELATRNLFLYRGSTFAYERPFSCSNLNEPISLSFGTSLFAGVVFDSGATVFYFMRKDDADGYVIAVPFEELVNSPFFTPLTHCIPQFYGVGEVFHARFKSWKGCTQKPKGVETMHVDSEKSWAHLLTNKDRDEMVQQFQRYFKNNVIFLK